MLSRGVMSIAFNSSPRQVDLSVSLHRPPSRCPVSLLRLSAEACERDPRERNPCLPVSLRASLSLSLSLPCSVSVSVRACVNSSLHGKRLEGKGHAGRRAGILLSRVTCLPCTSGGLLGERSEVSALAHTDRRTDRRGHRHSHRDGERERGKR